MLRLVHRFIRDRRGATALEYALLVSLLGIVISTALTALGVKLYSIIGTATAAIH